MRREPHVRFREGGGVKFPSATRPIPRNLFAEILRLIAELRPPPATSTAQGVRLSCVRDKLTGDARPYDRKIAIFERGMGPIPGAPPVFANYDVSQLAKGGAWSQNWARIGPIGGMPAN